VNALNAATRRPAPLAGHKYIGKNDQNGQKLQPDTPTHKLLAKVGVIAFHQIVQAEEQHGEYSQNGDGSGMVEKRLHPAYPLPETRMGLSLWVNGGNRQVAAVTTRAAKVSGEKRCITHLKFALGGKSLNPCASSYSAPAPRRVFPHSPAPCAFRLEAQ
jgi:hypothetical protein